MFPRISDPYKGGGIKGLPPLKNPAMIFQTKDSKPQNAAPILESAEGAPACPRRRKNCPGGCNHKPFKRFTRPHQRNTSVNAAIVRDIIRGDYE